MAPSACRGGAVAAPAADDSARAKARAATSRAAARAVTASRGLRIGRLRARPEPDGAPALRDEVLGLRVVTDDGVGRLLGVQLEPLADRHADAVPTQKLHHLRVVVQVRGGRIPPRVAAV